MGKSKIEWTDKTWNPVTGCTKISSGCDNCYAERMSKRLAGRVGYDAENPFQVTIHKDRMKQPLSWTKPCMVFVCSMGDLFHKDVPDEDIAAVFSVMAECPQHTFQVLTKRADRMASWFERVKEAPTNVWIGVTAENQRQATLRIPKLLQVPAAVRFVSCEPLLGPIDFQLKIYTPRSDGRLGADLEVCKSLGDGKIDWVIAGGETGHGARPPHPRWFRLLRDQCVESKTPFFFKQWGNWAPCDPTTADIANGRIRFMKDLDFSTVPPKQIIEPMIMVGKTKAGKVLDGETWTEFPRQTNDR